MAGIELDLANSRKTEIRLISSYHAVGEADVADSSGEIRVRLTSGQQVVCPISYITNGESEPHNVTIKGGRCRGI